MIDPDAVTWFAIDNTGKTHHVTPADVLGATVELVADSRVLHGLIERLQDHEDPEVARSIRWACREICGHESDPIAPDLEGVTKIPTVYNGEIPSSVLGAFSLSALVGLFTIVVLLVQGVGLLFN